MMYLAIKDMVIDGKTISSGEMFEWDERAAEVDVINGNIRLLEEDEVNKYNKSNNKSGGDRRSSSKS